MTYYIYALQNKINLKIYVGQTNNLKKRKREHKAKDRLKTKGTPIYRAIAKYGFENFEMIPIEEFESTIDVDEAEEFWIQFFETRKREFGYNLASGGRVNRGFKHTENFKKEKSNQMKIFFQTNRPHNISFNEKQIREIRQLFNTGDFSIRALSLKFNIDKSSISDIIYNKSYQDPNYIVNVIKINKIIENNKTKRFTIKIQNEFGIIFSSIKDAATYYSTSSDNIRYRLNKPNSKSNLPKLHLL